MPSNDYIPRKDAQFSVYANNFANRLAGEWMIYGFSSAQAQFLLGLVQDYVAKLAVSSNEGTRTSGTISAKDDARSACESLIRQYAMLIKENAGITDQQKIDIGVRPESAGSEPIEVPTTPPIIAVIASLNGSQTLRFADTATPDSRAKPFGAAALQLFVAVTDNENAPLSEAKLYGTFTTNPVAVAFSQPDAGKAATYYARWQSPRGQTGLWSVPVSMRIAA